MADNTWGQRSPEDPDAAPGQTPDALPDGQATATTSDLGRSFGNQRSDTTAQMPNQYRPEQAAPAVSTSAQNPAQASTTTPPLPPAQSAIGAALSGLPPTGSPAPGMSAPGLPTAAAPAPATSGERFAPGYNQMAAAAPVPQNVSQALPQNPAPADAIANSGPTAPPSVPPSVSSSGWSPLGATPSSPPVRTGQDAGVARYLPPVAPPESVAGKTTAAPAVEGTASRSGRWGWRALVSFVAGGIIAAAGFGAAQLAPSSETSAGTETAIAETAATTTTFAPRPATTQRDSGTVPLVPLDVDEPASFVAETLGPAVVQIDTELGVGSGVIYDDGLILTNNHVIQGSTQVRVQLADGSVLEGEVVGSDVKTDVGVVSVGPGLDLPRAQLALGEKAKVGQIAIAIGSPFDLQQSVTAGIVSAVDRPIPNTERGVVAMIQTDAPINPGNSGGALADRQGRVIGINTSIQTDGVSNANVGVGFAIPIDTAIRVADLLVAGEPIEPGFLGVSGDEPPGGEAGVVLVEVTPGSAAEGAGLLVGDRVLSLNGAPVTGFAELAGLVVANQAGDTVKLEIVRDEETIEVDVVLGINDN